MSATERHEAMQRVRIHARWIAVHETRLDEALRDAFDAGVSQGRLAHAIGVSKDTIRRHLRNPSTRWRRAA